MEAKKKYFMDCHLAGRMYHEADDVWNQLKVGTVLWLERDLDNRYDPNAVAVCYYDLDNDLDEGVRYVLGYIPREENESIATFFDMGWTGLFECRINRIVPEAHPEHQIHLTINVVRNPKTQEA